MPNMDQPTGSNTDWINKASPDEIVTHATALFAKLGTLPSSYQDRFVQEVRANPQAARVFEKIGGLTS